MRAFLRWRVWEFAKRHAAVIAVVWVTVIAGVAVAGVRWEASERDRQDEVATLRARADLCDFARRSQRSDRLLIDTVLDDSDSGGVPLLDVESFNALPQSVQTYVRDLAAGGDAEPEEGPSLAERLADFRDENLGTDDLPEFCRTPEDP